MALERTFGAGLLHEEVDPRTGTETVGLFQKPDGSSWVREPDGTETRLPDGGGGGGAPSGPAGGVLGGTYPNPGFAVDMATQAELDAVELNTYTIFNVKACGAVGDGVADDTAAIQACFDAAEAAIVPGTFGGNAVFFPNGRYRVTSTLFWKPHPIIGSSSWAVHIIWDGGAGGTVIDGTDAGRQWMQGIQFRNSGLPLPDHWVTKVDADWGDGFRDVFFGEATVAALKLGEIINAHLGPHVRFALRGFGIWIDHGVTGARSFTLDDFTFANGNGGAGAILGFIRLTGGGVSSSLQMAIRNGRLESASGTWAADSGLFVCDGVWSVIPAAIHMENLACQLDTQANNPSVFFKDAAVDNNCVPILTAVNCGLAGFSTWMAGTYPTSGSFPGVPALPADRRTRFWTTGRLGSGSDQSTTRIQNMCIGPIGNTISQHLSATATWDPASVLDGAMTSTTVTVTGAVVGDTVAVGFSLAVPAGALLVGAVTAVNTVTVTLMNHTGGVLDLGSGTVRADVWQH